MKNTGKILLLAASVCAAFAVSASAADITFTPEGGGKWIYCNNPEGLHSYDLMNHPDYDSTYIMNNAHLKPDLYDFLMCHINYTDTDGGYGAGFDIELDAEITAEADSVLTINKAFFETPLTESYIYGDGTWDKEMHKVGCLNALSSFLGVNFCERNGSWIYTAQEYEPVTVELKKGETVWLGDYIDNYSVVPYQKPVEIMGEFELESGQISFNIAAFKSNGTLHDRSSFNPKANFGSYAYTRTQKGIADSLPKVNAYLEYTINNTMQDGDFFLNKVYNQYEKDGFVTDTWCTHLNPQDDIWSKKLAAESDLLTFEYEDDSKLKYYGKKIKLNNRNNIWTWDPFHSDTAQYEGEVTWFEKGEEYYPNYELSPYRSNQGYACSMGNYCVTESYNIKVKNVMPYDRYFEYVSQTGSNIAVYVEDEDGKHDGYIKGEWDGNLKDVLASVKIPAKSEKVFSINVILPINYVGGLKNSFMVSYESSLDKTYEDFINEENDIEKGPLTYGVTADTVLDELPDDVKKIVDGRADNYELIKTDWGYMLRYMDWDGIPYYYYNNWSKLKNIYILDENYELKSHYTPDFIAQLALYYDGYYYIEDAEGKHYRTQDGEKWEKYNHRLPLPVVEFGENEPSDWAEDEIRRAYEIDAAPYDLKNKLDYTEPMTRTLFCYVLSSMLELAEEMPDKIDEKIKFTDTESKTIRKLAAAGIISGYEDGSFKPDGEITRQEAAMLLYKTYEYILNDGEEERQPSPKPSPTASASPEPSVSPDLLTELSMKAAAEELKANAARKVSKRYIYKDDDDIGEWAKDAVDTMHSTGIMQGVGGRRFAPKMTYTNEQSIATILRLYDTITEMKDSEI